MRVTVFSLWWTKLAKSPLQANWTVPYFRYSVIRSSAHRMMSRTRRRTGSAGFPFIHLSTSGSLRAISQQQKTGGLQSPPVRNFSSLSALLHGEQAERRALRVLENREAAAWKVLRPQHLLAAEVDGLLVGFVDIIGTEVNHPVGRDLGRHHRVHVHAAGDALSVELKLCVVAQTFAHRTHLLGPAEHLGVEILGGVEVSRVELGPSVRIRLAHHFGTVHLTGLPGRDEGATRILEDRHAAGLQDVERRRDHLAAGRLHLLGERIDVAAADVQAPGRRCVWILNRADPGDVLAPGLGERVA